jgi:tripartite-type tricarboxylate transporter receptor subunit TctC
VKLVLAAALFALAAGEASAQDKYPNRTIKILVPYAPGGATDIVARIIGEEMHKSLGQPVVVENKPGGYGILAIQEMVRSKPDGYTLMVGNVSTNAITPLLYKKTMSFDYDKSVAPVTALVDIPAFVVLTTKDFAPKTLPEFVAYAKQHKGDVRYGHVGAGSYPQYDAEVFAQRAGVALTGIPNRAGASGILKDMAAGDIHMAFLNVASSAGLIKAGRIRAVGLVNPKRLHDYPDVPTMEELGFKDVGTLAWQALFAPAGTPPAVLETIHKATLAALQSPLAKDRFGAQHFNIVPNASLAEAKTWLAGQMDNWKSITERVKIQTPQ